MQVEIKKLYEESKLPTQGSEYAAGYDVYAYIPEGAVSIPPHQTKLISTGIALATPVGYASFLYARSGLATKQGVRPANCVGVIDADYRGEVFMGAHNDTDEIRTVTNGDRIGQLIIAPVEHIEWKEVSELDVTKRGAGGFGSTGL